MLSALHVIQISFFRDPEERLPKQLLEAWPSLVDVAEAACAGGTRITVVQASLHSRASHPGRGGLSLFALRRARAAGKGERGACRAACPILHRTSSMCTVWDSPAMCCRCPRSPRAFRSFCKIMRTSRPASGGEPYGDVSMAAAAGVAFCARSQARPFAGAGLLAKHTPVYEIPGIHQPLHTGEPSQGARADRPQGEPRASLGGALRRQQRSAYRSGGCQRGDANVARAAAMVLLWQGTAAGRCRKANRRGSPPSRQSASAGAGAP